MDSPRLSSEWYTFRRLRSHEPHLRPGRLDERVVALAQNGQNWQERPRGALGVSVFRVLGFYCVTHGGTPADSRMPQGPISLVRETIGGVIPRF
jgi:hypothetical protein